MQSSLYKGCWWNTHVSRNSDFSHALFFQIPQHFKTTIFNKYFKTEKKSQVCFCFSSKSKSVLCKKWQISAFLFSNHPETFIFGKWRFIFSVCLGTPTNFFRQHFLVRLHSIEYKWFCSYFRLMVMLAWLMTLIFSWPQAVIFRVMKHPNKEFYQCTTFNFFENLALGIGNDSFYRKLKQVIEE